MPWCQERHTRRPPEVPARPGVEDAERMIETYRTLEHSRRGKDQREPFRTFRQIDSQWRHERRMESRAEPEVVLQSVQIEIGGQSLDLAGVGEEHRIEIAIDHDAPLTLEQQAVAIAESPAAVPAQVATTAQRRQHEVRNLLIAFQPRRLDETTHRDDPRLAKD